MPSLKIELDRKINVGLRSKRWSDRPGNRGPKMTDGEIVSSYKAGKEDEGGIKIMAYAYGEETDFSLLSRGYELTRYFTEGDFTYCVFEKLAITAKELARAA